MPDAAVAERTLPHNLEAERSVLGAILLHNDAFNLAAEVIDSTDFFRDAHRRIFDKMVKLSERGDAIDLVTLKEELGRSSELDEVVSGDAGCHPVEGELLRALLAGRGQLGEALHADVVGATLEHRPGEGDVEVSFQEGEVLARQLVLERLGGGGDDGVATRQDGRHEVGERLARAGAGLHRHMLAFGDALADGGGHLLLPLAHLTAAGQLGHHPLESGGDGVRHPGDAIGRG